MGKMKALADSSKTLQIKKRKVLKEAKMIMSHLNYEEEVQSLKRRWLIRRWPEYLDSIGSSSKDLSECGFLEDRYIPVTLLRDDNSAVILKSKIQESFDAFKEALEIDQHSHKVEQSNLQQKKNQGLPGKELFASIPVFLEHLRLSALHTLANIVTGKPYQSSRKYTIKKIQHGLSMLFAQVGQDVSERLQEVQKLLQNPHNILPAYTTGLTQMSASGIASAKSVFSQLQKLPLHTLYAMNRKLLGKPHEIKLEFNKISGNKCLLAQNIKKRGKKLLRGLQEGDELPERLKKSLLVASLSARQTYGDDGGLLQKLGSISPEVDVLHNDFLKAISYVQKLEYLELKDSCGCLFSDNQFPSRACRGLQHAIRSFLIDWMFESCDRTIPEPVRNSISMINKVWLMKEAKKGLTEIDPISRTTEQRLDRELECVLNVSSHMKQYIYDWAENAGLDREIDDVNLDNSDEECEPWFTEDSCDSLEVGGQEAAYVGESCWEPKVLQGEEYGLQENAKEHFPGVEFRKSSKDDVLSKNDCHAEDTGREIEQQIQEICDEAGLFAYHLIGCTMDEFLGRQGHLLDGSTRRYLRTGLQATAEGEGNSEACASQQSMDVSIVLNAAQKLWPQMPKSVMEKVKLSLGLK